MAEDPDLFENLETAPLGASTPLDLVLNALKFDHNGLIPAIAQDSRDQRVLMLGWMNRTSIERTLAQGYACYWSRSRQEYWKKGETSGHTQRLEEMRLDCDGDAILLMVEQTGPACHTNRPGCFYLSVDGNRVKVTSEPE